MSLDKILTTDSSSQFQSRIVLEKEDMLNEYFPREFQHLILVVKCTGIVVGCYYVSMPVSANFWMTDIMKKLQAQSASSIV